VLLPPLLPDAELDVEDDDGAGAAVEEVVLLLLEPPHAANPSVRAMAPRERAEILGTCVPLVRYPVAA
jgi:hypothetical protein